MSFSNPTPTNPAEHFFEWRSGKVQFYDKEKKESITIPLPFTFIVIDQLHTITGYSDEDESGFWSNEIRSLRDEFNVRTKKGTQYYGTYKNSQGSVLVPRGARYTKSVYIAHKNKSGEYLLGNLKLAGAALTAWIEVTNGVDFRKNKISITGSTEGKKGATTYQIPTIMIVPGITEEEVEIATGLDHTLQAYLDQYLSTPKHEDVTPIDEEATTDEQVADFETKRDEASKQRANKEAAKEFDVDIDDRDTPIDLSEIPF